MATPGYGQSTHLTLHTQTKSRMKFAANCKSSGTFVRDMVFSKPLLHYMRSLNFNIRTLRAFLQGQRHNKASNHQDGREAEAVVDAACEAQGFASG